MPDTNALPLKRSEQPPFLRHINATPAVPINSSPMLKRANEHTCALHADSRTNTHSDPISSAAMIAATNA